MKRIIFSILLMSASYALADEVVITDTIEIMEFLSKNPEAQTIPMAATLASGSVTQVVSISHNGCLDTAGGKSMYVTLIMKSKGNGPSGSQSFNISCPK